MKPSELVNKVWDSALVIALFGGICYLLGFLRELGEAQRLQIPQHLTLDLPIEQRVLVGGFLALLIILIGVVAQAVARKVVESTPDSKVVTFFRNRLTEHPVTYPLLLGSSSIIAIAMLVMFAPVRTLYLSKDGFMKVTYLQTTSTNSIVSTNWYYLWLKNDVFLFRDQTSNQLILLNKEDVLRLELSQK